MLRKFSRLLIIALLLNAPLSLIGDRAQTFSAVLSLMGDCPDIGVSYNATEIRRSRAENPVVRKRAVLKTFQVASSLAASPVTQIEPAKVFSSAPVRPVCCTLQSPHHDRAPPATPAILS